MAQPKEQTQANFVRTERLRLGTYLEQVKQNIDNTSGELKKFWEREAVRTQRSLDKLV